MNVAWIITIIAAAGPLSPAASQTTPSDTGGTTLSRALGTRSLGAGSAQTAALTCAVATPAGRPLIFSPQVGLTPRKVSARAHLELTGCASPDGSSPYPRSGWASVKADALVSCTSARQVRGHAVITWFDVTGRPIGTSKLRIRADHLVAQHPADTLLTGKVAGGLLAGEHVRGGITPPTALLGCATRGMSALPGNGRIAFG